MSQVTLANAVGTGQSTISELETGETQMPSSEMLYKIAGALKVSPAWIMTGKEGELTTPTEEESDFLTAIRALEPKQRASLRSFLESLKK